MGSCDTNALPAAWPPLTERHGRRIGGIRGSGVVVNLLNKSTDYCPATNATSNASMFHRSRYWVGSRITPLTPGRVATSLGTK